MIVSLNGAVASDALEDGTVISGVGGSTISWLWPRSARRAVCPMYSQYACQGKQLQSNVVPRYGYTTIPKHLRDIVVTEYGVADLRGRAISTLSSA